MLIRFFLFLLCIECFIRLIDVCLSHQASIFAFLRRSIQIIRLGHFLTSTWQYLGRIISKMFSKWWLWVFLRVLFWLMLSASQLKLLDDIFYVLIIILLTWSVVNTVFLLNHLTALAVITVIKGSALGVSLRLNPKFLQKFISVVICVVYRDWFSWLVLVKNPMTLFKLTI